MAGDTWRQPAVAGSYLDGRRAHIPYAADQLQTMAELVGWFHPDPRRILDLGCGDGIAARVLLDRFPAASAVLVDHSGPMLERAQTAMASYAERVRLVQADLSSALPSAATEAQPDVIVSAYVIHHLPDERKQSLYTECFTALAPGGVFVNVEHVASATPELEALFDDGYCRNVAARTGRPFDEVLREYVTRPDRRDNLLAAVETQLGWLRDSGFAHVDCYFKWMELAVFGGIRPAGPPPCPPR